MRSLLKHFREFLFSVFDRFEASFLLPETALSLLLSAQPNSPDKRCNFGDKRTWGSLLCCYLDMRVICTNRSLLQPLQLFWQLLEGVIYQCNSKKCYTHELLRPKSVWIIKPTLKIQDTGEYKGLLGIKIVITLQTFGLFIPGKL